MAVTIRTNGWARIEGAEIENLYKEYGTFAHLPVEEQHVYYGHPEITLSNPTSLTHSSIYLVKSLKDYFGISSIQQLDQLWGTGSNLDPTRRIIEAQNAPECQIDDQNTNYYFEGVPFTVSESCVIFYDDSSKSSMHGATYDHYVLILVDDHATPRVTGIEAEYYGNPIPIRDFFDPNAKNTETQQRLFKVYQIYDNGDRTVMDSGYTIEPEDLMIKVVGPNTFTINFIDAEGELNTDTIIIQGEKRLSYISASWDGKHVAYNQAAEKKYITVIAHYITSLDGDMFETTVTDYVFPNGNIVTQTNQGVINIAYKDAEVDLQVPIFEYRKQRLVVHYEGPKVEVGHEFLDQYIHVQIYYQSAEDIGQGEFIDVELEDCEIPTKEVTSEGLNSFILRCEGILGPLEGTFSVIGFSPIVVPRSISARYTGPAIHIGGSFSLERIIVDVHNSDGTISQTKQFTVNTNTIKKEGDNEIDVIYNQGSFQFKDTIIIRGLETDTTTGNNIFPSKVDNKYPEAKFVNNRFRGPAESEKANEVSIMILENLRELYKLYTELEKQYNDIVDDFTKQNNAKILTLNTVSSINHEMAALKNDKHYSTGTYIGDEISEEY